jgi:hypothetical protein
VSAQHTPWKVEGQSKGGTLVSAGLNSYGDGPERYVGVLLDFSPADQALALAAPVMMKALISIQDAQAFGADADALDDLIRDLRATARAAISKALGQD